MSEIQRRITRLRDNGQTVHCPDCGFGFPVTDPGTADCLAAMDARIVELEAELSEEKSTNPRFY